MTPEIKQLNHVLTQVKGLMISSEQSQSFATLRAQYAAMDDMGADELRKYTETAAQWLSDQASHIEKLSDNVFEGADLSSPEVVALSIAFDHAHSCRMWIEESFKRLGKGAAHGL